MSGGAVRFSSAARVSAMKANTEAAKSGRRSSGANQERSEAAGVVNSRTRLGSEPHSLWRFYRRPGRHMRRGILALKAPEANADQIGGHPG